MVGAIMPWNYPFEVTIDKLGQALATGNTMIVKPAPDTPWNATRIGRLVAEKTDIPAGVFNVVTVLRPHGRRGAGDRPPGGPDLLHRVDGGRPADHGEGRPHPEAAVPRARRQVGRHRSGGRRLRRQAAVRVGSVCMHGGQGCAMLTRMLMPRSRYDEAVELWAGFGEGKLGDPTDPWVIQGPRSAPSSATGSSATSRRARPRGPGW